MKYIRVVRAAFVCSFLALAENASAQQMDADQVQASTLAAASVGTLSPLLMNAALPATRALVVGDGGYDTSKRGALFDSSAEARVWGPFALRVNVTYSDPTRRMRPSLGGRAQLLRQDAHGVDSSLSVFFKTEGFNEIEGEIETTFAIGRRFEHFYLLGNVAYGQDPEGRERDGELRASILKPQGRAMFGLEGRARSALGPQTAPNSTLEPRFDVVGGPIAMVSVSSFVLFAEAGPSAVKLQGADTRWGLASLGGVGSVF